MYEISKEITTKRELGGIPVKGSSYFLELELRNNR